MNIQNFDCITFNQHYSFIEESNALKVVVIEKSKEGNITAENSLDKIKSFILNEKYVSQWDSLVRISAFIVTKFSDKFEKKWFCSIFNSQGLDKLLNKHFDILNLIEVKKQNIKSPPPFFEIPAELINKVFSYLNIRSIKALSGLNRSAKAYTKMFYLKEAAYLNLPEDSIPPIDYLENISYMVDLLWKNGFIKQEYVILDARSLLDSKQLLRKLYEMKFSLLDILLPSSLNELPHFIIRSMLKTKSDTCSIRVETRFKILFQLLIKLGLSINSKDSEGNTPFHLAVAGMMKGYAFWTGASTDFLCFLLKEGADINVVNHLGYSPLCLGTMNAHFLSFLLDNHADPYYQNPSDGNTAFHYAAKKSISNKIDIRFTDQIFALLKRYKLEGIGSIKNHAGKTPYELLSIARDKQYAHTCNETHFNRWQIN